MLHDKQHRPTSLYYSQQPQPQPQQVPAVQPEYYRNPSYERQVSSSSSNSNLKKIYAEASMTAAIRSPTTPKTSVDFPSPIHDVPPPSTPTSNLKNIYSEALNQHNQQQQQHRVLSSSSSNVNYFEGKDSNLKRIFAEASESAAHPAPPHHQRVFMSTDSSSSDNRLNNIKHIVNEAAITNSLADKIAASTQVYAGPSQASYSTSYVPPQPQTTVIPGQVISEHRQEYSSSSASAVKQVISGGETVHHHQQQHHSQFYEASSSSTSSIGGGSPMISRPAINNQITLPTDSGIDRKSNLVNIMSDVIATNNSAYTAYPNRFQFTGPNANLKGIVAEAADYNARIAPSNQNMYHNLRNASLPTGDINPNSIIGKYNL